MSTPLLQQFPSLASQPPSFLKDLLSSPPLTEAFLFSLPEVQQLAGEVEQLGRENEEIANRNIQLRDELFALRDATAQSYADAEGLKSRWADIEKAQANLYQRQRPSFLHLRLRHSITAQDELCEKIASAFIEGRSVQGLGSSSNNAAGAGSGSYNGNGNGNSSGTGSGSGPTSRIDSPALGEGSADRGRDRSIDDFIAEFKAARKTYHKRALWAERWSRGEVAWRDD